MDYLQDEPAIDKICLNAKDLKEGKYKILINKRESAGIKYLNNSKTFTEYSIDMVNIQENIEEQNTDKKDKNINCI